MWQDWKYFACVTHTHLIHFFWGEKKCLVVEPLSAGGVNHPVPLGKQQIFLIDGKNVETNEKIIWTKVQKGGGEGYPDLSGSTT